MHLIVSRQRCCWDLPTCTCASWRRAFPDVSILLDLMGLVDGDCRVTVDFPWLQELLEQTHVGRRLGSVALSAHPPPTVPIPMSQGVPCSIGGFQPASFVCPSLARLYSHRFGSQQFVFLLRDIATRATTGLASLLINVGWKERFQRAVNVSTTG